MQLVGRVFPVNTYLRRIDKHPTGHCPFGCKDEEGLPVRETIGHFQSCCKQFEENRTLAHHGIVRAVMGALAGAQLKEWKFFYETPFNQLPFQLEWTEAEREEQEKRRPDGVAWHAATRTALFMEFTRCMDHPHTMAEALAKKGHQYDEAIAAIHRAQEKVRWKDRAVCNAGTIPMVFGVRGSVAYTDACQGLEWFKLTAAKKDKILAAGVREAIAGANDMCNARYAALQGLQRKARLPNGRLAKVIIPPKPRRPTGWRTDRGG
jgi:hypothetical protein